MRGRIGRPANCSSIGECSIVQRLAGDLRQDLRHFVGRDRAVAGRQLLELLEDLRGMRDGLVLAFDVNPVVAAGDRDAERVSDLAEMLVAGPEQSQQRLGSTSGMVASDIQASGDTLAARHDLQIAKLFA